VAGGAGPVQLLIDHGQYEPDGDRKHLKYHILRRRSSECPDPRSGLWLGGASSSSHVQIASMDTGYRLALRCSLRRTRKCSHVDCGQHWTDWTLRGGLTWTSWLTAYSHFFFPKAISAGLLLLAMVVDFVAEISLTYYIAPTDILSNASEIANMPAGRIAQLCVGVLLVIAIASGVFVLPRLKRRFATAILLISFAVACRGVNQLEVYLEGASGFQMCHHGAPEALGAAVLQNERPARSSTHQMMWEERYYADWVEEREDSRQPSTPMNSAAAIAYQQLSLNSRDPHSLPDFILILVESWGQPTDDAIRQWSATPGAAVASAPAWRCRVPERRDVEPLGVSHPLASSIPARGMTLPSLNEIHVCLRTEFARLFAYRGAIWAGLIVHSRYSDGTVAQSLPRFTELLSNSMR
jgi:hypothetical protein